MAVSILSSDFSLLASEASIELDNLLIGKGTSLEAAQQLAKTLLDTLGQPDQDKIPSASGIVTLVVRAFDTSSTAPKVGTVSELVSAAYSMAEQMTKTKEVDLAATDDESGNGRQHLAVLRDFASALSLSTASYVHEAHERDWASQNEG